MAKEKEIEKKKPPLAAAEKLLGFDVCNSSFLFRVAGGDERV